MTESPQAIPAEARSWWGQAWPLYRAMVGIGLLCGLAIVTMVELTAPRIARNRAAALEAAVFEVIDGVRHRTWELVDGVAKPLAPNRESAVDDPRFHAVHGPGGELAGFAIEAEGMGYQDTIRLIYGLSLEQQAVVGLRILDSRETPGLGDKIETEPHFLASFERLEVRLADDGRTILHPIEVVAQGQREHPWQIDGITGATISSRAVGSILRHSTAFWMPRLTALRADLDADLESSPPTRAPEDTP